ncbi:PadR family transcriptional regulator [Tsukamurella sp. 8F]|uniref:PadR family transcriptional regulator n=1 Tax=unclassified Tsukamurella TaxID=2633480 RepID=UPI0023B92A4B|nr:MULTISPECIES: PadR family transcriptional regulator [unclassified Tsukamurella]MDF0530392.1 PadR family transcriptional regulator [Tsukamurella sp. 8J]MDF0587787.1 PadR family transcriptional regulator [Tsukamurella sp. 8F]
MALKNAILAALLEGESSGYDLAKGFDSSVANFWVATPQQLYKELDKLEADGLIEARVVEQERRPNKRVFRLTPRGGQALATFTEGTPRPTAIRDELLVMVQALDAGNAAAVRHAIDERSTLARGKLHRYERIRDVLLDGRDEDTYFERSDRIGPYLTLLRGIAFEHENIRWCTLALRILDQRS